MKLVESLIGWEVTVGQGSECHLTFVRGILHIAEYDPVSTINIEFLMTLLMTLSMTLFNLNEAQSTKIKIKVWMICHDY